MIDFLLGHTPLLYLSQSLWRDEAFSVALATHSPQEIISLTSKDFNTPLYYLILHVWMLFFGSSEVSIRLLSFIPHILGVIVSYKLGRQFLTKNQARLLALIVFINPMLLTYALEARGYSWFAFFALLSMYAMYRKKWLIYAISSVLGFYTHTYFLLLIAAQMVYQLIVLGIINRSKRITSQIPFVISLVNIGVLIGFWLPVTFKQWQNSQSSWIYKPDLQLLLAVLGNLYTSYDGTPGGLWQGMAFLSLIMAVLFIWTYWKKKAISIFLLVWIFVPLVSILAVSFIKPLFVNRYMIFITVPISMLVTLGILSIERKWLRNTLFVILVAFLLYTNYFFSTYRKKFDSRKIFTNIAAENQGNLPIFVDSLFYFDALYYYPDSSRVMVYHEPGTVIPPYVGLALIRATVVSEVLPGDGSFYQVNGQGEVYINMLQ